MQQAKGLPAWITKRDGRRVPFEPDRISQVLFAATEAQGKPDAFLARELADGILHFVGQEWGASETPTTAQLSELVIKIVRELGQPALAETFACENQRRGEAAAKAPRPQPALPESPRQAKATEVVFRFAATDPPEAVVRACLSQYSLHAVFSRDVAAAQAEGWLTLSGLEAPLTLAGAVVSPVFVKERAIGQCLGRFFVVDGPEYAASQADWLTLQESTGLTAVVNLNCAAPPAWAVERIAGPLFAEPRGRSTTSNSALDEALEHWLAVDPARVHLAWHTGEADFQAGAPRLRRLARLATEARHIDFVFDRARHPILLAKGVDRKHPAVLLYVGLQLTRLLRLPDVGKDAQQFLLKLPSLGRMAISAAVQKRTYLRHHAGDRLSRGFLLDRARLVVVPVGLDEVCRSLTAEGMGANGNALALAQQILATLSANLRADGQAASLDVCVDGALGTLSVAEETALEPGLAAGKAQVRAAGLLHVAAGLGTAVVTLPKALALDHLLELLHFAWKHTDVVRIEVVRPSTEQGQLAL